MATLTKTAIEGPQILRHLYSDEWFGENATKEIYFRYYSMPCPPSDNFYLPGIEGDVLEYAGTMFKVVVANIADQKYSSFIPWLVHSESGNNEIFVERIERQLPETNYALITTPMQEPGELGYTGSSLKMDGFVGVLRVIGGNNLLRQLVREGSADVSTGNIRELSSIAPSPIPGEGPFATIETWLQLKEITNALTGSNHPQKGRIELSTQLVERAFLAQGSFKFFSYWVAIEVAADTHSTGKIITLLTRAYRESRGYVLNDLGFAFLKDTRTAVFHHGEPYEIPSDVERYVQCLFLDIVREKLGLKCRQYMATAIKNGFNVYRVDRTVAQAEVLTITTP